MASANVTLASMPHEFEADGTQRTATLTLRGGWLRNQHATELAYANFDAGAVTTAQPDGYAHATLKPGQVIQIPPSCAAFTFKAGASTFIQYSPTPMA